MLFRAQSKDAMPSQVPLRKRTLRLRHAGERVAPLRVLTSFSARVRVGGIAQSITEKIQGQY